MKSGHEVELSDALRVMWLTNIPLPPVKSRQGVPAFGGGGWLSAGLEALRSCGKRVQVVCVARSWPAPDPFEERGVRYLTLPTDSPTRGVRGVIDAWSDGMRDRLPVLALQRLIASERPAIVHVHGTETPNTLGAIRAAAETSTPVLVSIQGPVSEYAPLFFRGFGAGDIVRDILTFDFLKGRGVVHQWRRMRHAAARERETLPLVADAAGRTEWDRAIVLRANPSVRYHHVGEVLREPFYATEWRGGADGTEPTILAVTSAAPYKGIDVLLRAFARARKSHPCRLRVVGDVVGTPLWRSLGRLERALDLTGHVDWVGPCDAGTVAGMISTCDVFACASLIENSPNSVCEAMLVGAPVVASRVGGIPSLISHEQDGLLFESGDEAALAAAITRLLDDPGLARALGARARDVAAERHDPTRVALEMEAAYADTIAGTVR